jgi:hypothetical protein
MDTGRVKEESGGRNERRHMEGDIPKGLKPAREVEEHRRTT